MSQPSVFWWVEILLRNKLIILISHILERNVRTTCTSVRNEISLRNKSTSLIGVGWGRARRHRIQVDKGLKGIKDQRAGKAENSRWALLVLDKGQRTTDKGGGL